MTSQITSVSGAVISLVIVRCRYCDKPFATVSSPAVIEFRCADRGCRMNQRQDV